MSSAGGRSSRRNRSGMRNARTVKARHALSETVLDPQFEMDLAENLKSRLAREQLLDAFADYSGKTGAIDVLMRRVCFRALVKRLGSGLMLGKNVSVIHPETFEIGNRVFIGEQTIIQGRFDGRCVIGEGVWIGPQAYFDARDLVIEDFVGWGPGAKVLGSEHTGVPADVPIIQTNLEIAPVRIGAWADIGVSAVILPGITIGRGAVVGAGAVVTRDVAEFEIVAGVPARHLRLRTEQETRASQSKRP